MYNDTVLVYMYNVRTMLNTTHNNVQWQSDREMFIYFRINYHSGISQYSMYYMGPRPV